MLRGALIDRWLIRAVRRALSQSLAHEVGQRLGCGAHVTHVRREALGGFSVDNAWSLDVMLPVARKFGRKKKSK